MRRKSAMLDEVRRGAEGLERVVFALHGEEARAAFERVLRGAGTG